MDMYKYRSAVGASPCGKDLMHSHLVSRVEELAAERLRSFLLCVHSGKHVEAKLHYKGHMALYNKLAAHEHAETQLLQGQAWEATQRANRNEANRQALEIRHVAAREADRVRVLELKNQVAAMRWDNIQEANQRQEAEDQMKAQQEALTKQITKSIVQGAFDKAIIAAQADDMVKMTKGMEALQDTLTALITKSTAQGATDKAAITALTADISALTTTLANVRAELAASIATNASQAEHLRLLAQESQACKAQLDSQVKTNNTLSLEVASLKPLLQEKEDSNHKTQAEELSALKTQALTFSNTINTQLQEIEAMRETIKTQAQELSDLNTQLDSQAKTNSALSREVACLKSLLRQKEDSNRYRKTQAQDSWAELSALKTQALTFSNTISTQAREVEGLWDASKYRQSFIDGIQSLQLMVKAQGDNLQAATTHPQEAQRQLQALLQVPKGPLKRPQGSAGGHNVSSCGSQQAPATPLRLADFFCGSSSTAEAQGTCPSEGSGSEGGQGGDSTKGMMPAGQVVSQAAAAAAQAVSGLQTPSVIPKASYPQKAVIAVLSDLKLPTSSRRKSRAGSDTSCRSSTGGSCGGSTGSSTGSSTRSSVSGNSSPKLSLPTDTRPADNKGFKPAASNEACQPLTAAALRQAPLGAAPSIECDTTAATGSRQPGARSSSSMLDGLLLGSCQSSRQSSRHSSCHSSRSSNAGSPQADAQSSEAPSAACDPKLQPAAASSKFDFSLDLQLGNRTPSPADVEALMAACAPRFRPPFIDWAADNRSLSTQGDIFRRGCELYLQGAAGEADDWAGSSMAHTSQVSAASGAAAMPEARAQADRDMAAMADAQAVRDAEWLSCTQLASTRPSGRSSSRRHKGRKGSRK